MSATNTTILLDLNYTLVGNSQSSYMRDRPYEDCIREETYRLDLIELIRPHHVVLVTVRNAKYQAVTLEHIQDLTGGWLPDDCYFRDRDCSPPEWKGWVLKQVKKERPNDKLVAIESNDDNAAMYVAQKVLVLKCWGGQHKGPLAKKRGVKKEQDADFLF